ncbi:MAG: hypothetical protein IT450_16825 [Phycisphaerales bacterium]|nr:hypothetical protein [Phycisphaerales bacterium]
MGIQGQACGCLTQEIDPGVPDEIVLFRPGIIHTTRYDPRAVNAAAGARCVDAYRRLGRDLVIDYEHAGLSGARFKGEAPAAGWIKSLRWDDRRGLLARVQWTAKARAMIQNREIRYLSPVYTSDGGQLRELLAASLTNDPAMIDPAALAASRSAEIADKGSDDRSLRIGELAMALGDNNNRGDLDRLIAFVNKPNAWLIAPLLGLPRSASADEVKAALVKEFRDDPIDGTGGGPAPSRKGTTSSAGASSASRDRPLIRNSAVGMAVRLDALEQGRSLSNQEFYAEVASEMERRRKRQFVPDWNAAMAARRRRT